MTKRSKQLEMYHEVRATIDKYLNKHGTVHDYDIVSVLTNILADILAVTDTERANVLREIIDHCIDEKVAFIREHMGEPPPPTLHS